MSSESNIEHGFRSKHHAEQVGEPREHRTIVQRVHRHIVRHICKFGVAWRALFPVKPALRLSQIEHCSERGAQYQIDGERRLNARSTRALLDEVTD